MAKIVIKLLLLCEKAIELCKLCVCNIMSTLAEHLLPDEFHAVEYICESSNSPDIKLPMLEESSFTHFPTQS